MALFIFSCVNYIVKSIQKQMGDCVSKTDKKASYPTRGNNHHQTTINKNQQNPEDFNKKNFATTSKSNGLGMPKADQLSEQNKKPSNTTIPSSINKVPTSTSAAQQSEQKVQIPEKQKNVSVKIKQKQSTNKKIEKQTVAQTFAMQGFGNALKASFVGLKNGDNSFHYPILQFIQNWVRDQVENQGKQLYSTQQIVEKDIKLALQISKIQAGQIQLRNPKIVQMNKQGPDFGHSLTRRTTESITDRIYQIIYQAIQTQQKFRNQMKILCPKQAKLRFDPKLQSQLLKTKVRVCTKILQPYFDQKQKSRQVYEDLNHEYWEPALKLFTKIIKQRQDRLKIRVYNILKATLIFANEQQLQKCFLSLKKQHGQKIFQVKNRLYNKQYEDVLINMIYNGTGAQISLTIQKDHQKRLFHQKLMEILDCKLGVSYKCFSELLVEPKQSSNKELSTKLGMISCVPLREMVPAGFSRLTLQEALEIQQQLNGFVNTWQLMALHTGKLQGFGYGKLFNKQLYSLETTNMAIRELL